MLSLFDFAAIAILQCFLTNLESGGTVNTPASLMPFIEAVNSMKHDENQVVNVLPESG
jgi:hypothetical protein